MLQNYFTNVTNCVILPPAIPPGGKPIAATVEPYLCITAPCGPGAIPAFGSTPSPASGTWGYGPPSAIPDTPPSWGPLGWQDILSIDFPELAVGVMEAPMVGVVSDAENAQIDLELAQQEEARRPIVAVTAQEAQEFYEDLDNILARTGRTRESLEPEHNPILVITDAPPPQEESPPPVFQLIPGIDVPEWLEEPTIAGVDPNTGFPDDTAPRQDESDPLQTESEEQPMGWLDELVQAVGTGIAGSIDGDPATPGIFQEVGSSLPDIIGSYFVDTPSGPVAVPPPGGGVTPGTPATGGYTPNYTSTSGGTVGCISQRDVRIAQQVGVTPQTVDAVLAAARQGRRRRRRMLTKSDVGDISTMSALLGKNSEAFKTWLAKATR